MPGEDEQGAAVEPAELVVLNEERQRIAVEPLRVCEVWIQRRKIFPQHLLMIGVVEIDAEDLGFAGQTRACSPRSSAGSTTGE